MRASAAVARCTLPDVISDGGNGYDLTKVGGGTLILAGTSTYTGSTSVADGFLAGRRIDCHEQSADGRRRRHAGRHGHGPRGRGRQRRHRRPRRFAGHPGSGNASFASGSTFSVELNGTTVGTQYDQLDVTGTVNLGGSTLSVATGFTAAPGDRFTIINNDGSDAVVGTFAGLAEGATFTAGSNTFRISYVGGTNNNDVVLTDRRHADGRHGLARRTRACSARASPSR